MQHLPPFFVNANTTNAFAARTCRLPRVYFHIYVRGGGGYVPYMAPMSRGSQSRARLAAIAPTTAATIAMASTIVAVTATNAS